MPEHYRKKHIRAIQHPSFRWMYGNITRDYRTQHNNTRQNTKGQFPYICRKGRLTGQDMTPHYRTAQYVTGHYKAHPPLVGGCIGTPQQIALLNITGYVNTKQGNSKPFLYICYRAENCQSKGEKTWHRKKLAQLQQNPQSVLKQSVQRS